MGSKKGGKYISIGEFPIDDVLPYVIFGDVTHGLRKEGIKRSDEQWKAICQKEYCGVMVDMTSMRYRVFATKGVKCTECGLEGSFFSLESHYYKSNNRYYHFNLYAIDKDGDKVLMTKDHIIPKSKGGLSDMANLQPMCTVCNGKKADKLQPSLDKSFKVLFKEIMERFRKAEKARIKAQRDLGLIQPDEALELLKGIQIKFIDKWKDEWETIMNEMAADLNRIKQFGA